MKELNRWTRQGRMGFLMLLLAIGVSACCCKDDVEIADAWIRKVPGNVPMAGYFSITNHTSYALILTGVESNDFEHTHFHQTIEENGQAKMKAVGDLMIEPDATVSFEPGGRHIMLMKPKHEIKEGDQIMLILSFEDGSQREVPFVVKASFEE